jgi:nucleotide-binding universal stress UspA family protein
MEAFDSTEGAMQNLLVPVDGSDHSDAAVREAIKRAQAAGRAEVHILNVQPRVFSEETLVYMPQDRIDTYYYEQGSKALASAERLLKEAGVAFTAHRAVGPVAETIVQKARDLGCDGIVMGTQGRGRILGALLGSVSLKVLQLSEVPVTLVRVTGEA